MKGSKFVVQFSSEEGQIQIQTVTQNNKHPEQVQYDKSITAKNYAKMREVNNYVLQKQGAIKQNVFVNNPKINQIQTFVEEAYDNINPEKINKGSQNNHNNLNRLNAKNQFPDLQNMSKTNPILTKDKKDLQISVTTTTSPRRKLHKLKLDPLSSLHKTEAVRLKFFQQSQTQPARKKNINEDNQNIHNTVFNLDKNRKNKINSNLAASKAIKIQQRPSFKEDKLQKQQKERKGIQKMLYFDLSDQQEQNQQQNDKNIKIQNKITFQSNKKTGWLDGDNTNNYKLNIKEVGKVDKNNIQRHQIELKNKISNPDPHISHSPKFPNAQENHNFIQKPQIKTNFQSEKKIKRRHLDLSELQFQSKQQKQQPLVIKDDDRPNNNKKKQLIFNLKSPKNRPQYEEAQINGLEDIKLLLTSPLKRNTVFKLIFKRDQSGLKWFSPQFNVYVQNDLSFLFSAKKVSSKPSSKFILSTYKQVFDVNFPSYLGKMKSNILGQTLNIFGQGLNPQQAKKNFTQPRQLLATIVYETNLFGSTNKPKSFKVYIKNETADYYKVFPQVKMYSEEIPLNILYEKSEANRNFIKVYKNREATFSKEDGGYILNFYGRVKLASIKNFILEELGVKRQMPSVLFGKVSDEIFHLDIYEGMSANIAFCVALSIFDSRVGE